MDEELRRVTNETHGILNPSQLTGLIGGAHRSTLPLVIEYDQLLWKVELIQRFGYQKGRIDVLMYIKDNRVCH